ncbi:MAG: FUSC family protein [Verrucomicrobiae bacterium]
MEDPAIRNGIKFALAGTLSLFFALLLRLDQPTWAVTTAFVLSTPKFVGAIAEKTALRVVGALAGALIGYLITGSLEQTPVLFLGAMGALVAFGTAMFGGTLAPYGFRQCGYTATLVAAQGIGNPAFSWHVGLARCEEICLGIVVTMIVTTTIWPRFARKEFAADVRQTLRVLAKLFRQRAETFLCGSVAPAPDVLGTVGGRLAKLRKMIRLGRMESVGFKRHLAEVEAVVARLGSLSTALSNFGRALPSESLLREYIEAEAIALHGAVDRALEGLADPAAPASLLRENLECVRQRLLDYESGLMRFRLAGEGDQLTVDESLEHAGYALSIHEIVEDLGALTDLLPEIAAGQTESFPTIHFEKFTLPDAGWMKSGIRGGLAVVVGLFFLNWLNPPGGDLLVVGAYLFTAFSLESSDRMGDLGAFNSLVACTLVSGIFFVFLLFAAPMMSSYAVLNIILATFLFLTGYFLEAGVIGSFSTLLILLMCVILVGLNGQRPVGFQQVAGPVIGLVLALVLAAVLRRLIWPALPQDALRTRLAELLGLLEKSASRPGSPLPVPDRANIALSAADALVLTGVVGNRVIPAAEAERLRAYIRCLARLGGHLIASAGQQPLPDDPDRLFPDAHAGLLATISSRLRSQRHAVMRKQCLPPPPEALDVRSWTASRRVQIRASGLHVRETSSHLGFLYRHEQAASAINEASRIAATISFDEDFSDHIL